MSTIGQEMTFNRFQGEAKEDLQERLHKESSLFYSHRTEYLGLSVFTLSTTIGTYQVIAESQQDAEEIYKIATQKDLICQPQNSIEHF